MMGDVIGKDKLVIFRDFRGVVRVWENRKEEDLIRMGFIGFRGWSIYFLEKWSIYCFEENLGGWGKRLLREGLIGSKRVC